LKTHRVCGLGGPPLFAAFCYPSSSSSSWTQETNLAPIPPMGWNSWNHFAECIDDKTMRAQADAMVESGLKDAG
jgi:hypothetical protein